MQFLYKIDFLENEEMNERGFDIRSLIRFFFNLLLLRGLLFEVRKYMLLREKRSNEIYAANEKKGAIWCNARIYYLDVWTFGKIYPHSMMWANDRNLCHIQNIKLKQIIITNMMKFHFYVLSMIV